LQNAFITFAERHIPAEKARRLAEPVGEFFLFTLAAQVTTLPIMAVQFQQISVSALIANPLVLPPQPLVMVLGGIAVVAGMIFLPLGQLLAYVAWPLIAYTNRMVEFLAQLPHGMIKLGETGLIWALLFYAILFSLTFGLPRWPAIRQQLSPTLALVASALLAVFIWRNVLSLPDQRLHVYVFPIADGPAYLIRSPGGNNILINGGSNTSQLQEALARRLPLYTETLDGAILTTTSGPMFEGLANTFTRYPPGLVVWEGPGKNQKAAKQLADQLSQLPNRQVAIPADGLALSVDRDIVMRVVSVTEDYTALQLQWGRFNALIPGGVGEDQIKQALKGNPGKISLVLLTEADLKNSPAADWQSLGASLTVTSGQGKGSIPQEWLNALQHGWVSITSDGQKMWIETER
jgi:competence protein ComEC